MENSSNFNFCKTQIRVPSSLNLKVWNLQLSNYWDKQLLQLLKYGFPLDVDQNAPLKITNWQ